LQAVCHVVTVLLHLQIPVQNLELDQQAAARPAHQALHQQLQPLFASGLVCKLRWKPERSAMMTAYQCVMQNAEAMPTGVSQLLVPQPAALLCCRCSYHDLTNTRLDKTGLCAHEQSGDGQSVFESTSALPVRHMQIFRSCDKIAVGSTCMIAHGFCLSCSAASAPKYLSSTLGPLDSVKST